ncbi:OmpA family protein [Rhodoblastus acidophilus]|uniref:OmpA family protein n=1 Tax=Rhodoblastus acidophilus TaxID=1074 RepID=UPI000B50D381|nr:OmpA family protein [Rhodoblastus acidophilus]PPQ40654.1 hypothetical protein CKO16_02670 [Rhodoblastus acidophilus]RAI16705.1 hypothetical protein CH337_19960 [Rhodoblastus acidophilus]
MTGSEELPARDPTQAPDDAARVPAPGPAQTPAQIPAQAPGHAQAQPQAPRARLHQAAAIALSEALRRAEVANHQQLAQEIAPLLVDVIGGEIEAEPALLARAAALRPVPGAVRRIWGEASRPPDKDAPPKPKLNRILALEKPGFAVIASWRQEGLAVEPTSTLVAAIKQFSSRDIHPPAELRVMNFHGGRVLMRASPRLILAAQFSAEPNPQDRARLDAAFKNLIKNEKPTDADLAGVVGRLKGAEGLRLTPARVAIAAAALLALGAALFGILREGPEARLQRLAAAAQAAQPALASLPLRVSFDRDAHVALLSGLAPADADLDAFVRALPDATPYRWELRMARIGGGDGETRLSQRMEEMAAEMRADRQRLAALADRLDRAEKWQADRTAEAETPRARLERLTRDVVILFLDEDHFLDPDQARRQIAEIAALLKATDSRLRVVGYSDSHGPPPKNLALSRARADVVRNLLVDHGIEPQRLIAVGRADHAPIAAENSADRRRNRRVTFEALDAAD